MQTVTLSGTIDELQDKSYLNYHETEFNHSRADVIKYAFFVQ
jgi:hypothetical protein